MKTKLELLKELKKQSCSPDFINWVESQPTSSAQIIWDNCQNGQWMLYLLGKRTAPNTQHHRNLVKAACLCAREVLHLIKKGEVRPLKAIETAEAWAEGRATLEEVRAAAAAAYAAAYAASAAANAAYAAANAAYAAAANAYAAAANAYAAAAAAVDAADAANAAWAANAANAAWAAASANAAWAAASANAAGGAVEGTGAKQKMLNKCAELTRTVFPEVPLDWEPNDVMKSIL